MTKPVQLTARIRIESRTSDATLIAPVFAYTDYPLWFLGDEPGQPAPMRMVEVIGYDGNKYARIKLGDGRETIKRGYLYKGNNTELRVNEELLMELPREW